MRDLTAVRRQSECEPGFAHADRLDPNADCGKGRDIVVELAGTGHADDTSVSAAGVEWRRVGGVARRSESATAERAPAEPLDPAFGKRRDSSAPNAGAEHLPLAHSPPPLRGLGRDLSQIQHRRCERSDAIQLRPDLMTN